MISAISANNNVYSQRNKMNAKNTPAFGSTLVFNPKILSIKTATPKQEMVLLEWVARKMKNFEHTFGVESTTGRSHTFRAKNGAEIHLHEDKIKKEGKLNKVISYYQPNPVDGIHISYENREYVAPQELTDVVNNAISAIKSRIEDSKTAFFK